MCEVACYLPEAQTILRDAAERHRSLAYVRAARSRRCHRLRMSYIIMCRVAAPQNTRNSPRPDAAIRHHLGWGHKKKAHSKKPVFG